MPGTYTAPVVLYSFIDIVGSGQENTIITSSATTTLQTESDNVVENLTISNSAFRAILVSVPSSGSLTMRNVSLPGGSNTPEEGIVCGMNCKLELSHVKITGDYYAFGIRIGNNTKITVLDSYIDIQNPDYWCVGILADYTDSLLTLRNSTVKVRDYNTGSYAVMAWNFDISDCVISVEPITGAPSTGNYGLWVYGTGKVRGTEIAEVSPAGSGGAAVRSNGYPNPRIEFENCAISGTDYSINKDWGTSFMIANSKIKGPHNGVPGADRIVNCHDENYLPIPNF